MMMNELLHLCTVASDRSITRANDVMARARGSVQHQYAERQLGPPSVPW